MVKQNIYTIEKKEVGTVELSETIFNTDVKPHLIHEVVKTQRANLRAGCASTKNRSEVKASNAKPYRQKGTGRARHGSWVSPIFVGGGITFGPKPRDYSLKMNKKTKKAALKSALTNKVQENRLLVIDKWVEKKKTKEMVEIFKKLEIASALIVVNEPTLWLEQAVRNIPYVNVIYTDKLNAYVLIKHDYVICTKDVVDEIQERLEK